MPYTNKKTEFPEWKDSTNLWDLVSVKENDNSIIIKLLWVFWLDTNRNNDHKFLDYARAIINMALGLVAFIALIMSIYTFYMMFFSENEAGIKKAKWNLIGIFIALAIIWLSWLIVSFIFRWYENSWYNRQDEIKEAAITLMVNQELSNQIYLNV